ncbi:MULTISPECIES: Qat anti-phage system TatD family nuclease QatD [Hyphomonas]|jgi:TatD DNase family protein
MMDLHCHLDLYPNPESIVAEIIERKIYVLSVTTTPSAWRGTRNLATGASRIQTALGLHPQLASQRANELDLFESLLPQAPYIGEIGLDGAPEHKETLPLQRQIFRSILEMCADAGGRILSIHSRRAASAVLDDIEQRHHCGRPILHWFTGSQSELNRAISLGCWFSVGPAMLRSNRGRALVEKMPRDRILLETDGPFAQPDGVPLMPWQATDCIPALGRIWKMQNDQTNEQLLKNLRHLNESACAPRPRA